MGVVDEHFLDLLSAGLCATAHCIHQISIKLRLVYLTEMRINATKPTHTHTHVHT